MKLAEALQERADLNRQIEQLRSRLSHNAIVQEGEAPAEDPGDLLAQLDRATARLEELMASINLANSRTVVNDKTLTQIIARKDCLRLRLEAYRELAETASQTARRATRSEIRILSTVDVKTIQAQVDTMAKELRMDTVMEGVETPKQLAFLRTTACDMVQGFVFSRPVPPEEFYRLLDTVAPDEGAPRD